LPRELVDAARGEQYAEAYALWFMDEVWPAYAERLAF
jgi:hypothetical protein